MSESRDTTSIAPGDGWTADDMAALGHLHARLEAEQKLEPLLDTLVAEPVYAFHPLGLGFSGADFTRHYYAQFFEDFMSRIVGHALLDEWVNERSVVQEYDITCRVEGGSETHRVVGILFVDDADPATPTSARKLGGERIFGSEALVRLMTGKLYDELQPIR
jgi:hypothetical protein